MLKTLLLSILSIFSASAMDQALFTLVNKPDATAQEVYDLVEQGADVQARDNFDYTPLMRAAIKSNGNVCQALITKGASIESYADLFTSPLIHLYRAQNSDLKPIDLAVRAGNYEACKALLENGADVFSIQSTEGDDIFRHSHVAPLNYCALVLLANPQGHPGRYYFNIVRDQVEQERKNDIKKILPLLFTHSWSVPDFSEEVENNSHKIIITFLCCLKKYPQIKTLKILFYKAVKSSESTYAICYFQGFSTINRFPTTQKLFS